MDYLTVVRDTIIPTPYWIVSVGEGEDIPTYVEFIESPLGDSVKFKSFFGQIIR